MSRKALKKEYRDYRVLWFQIKAAGCFKRTKTPMVFYDWKKHFLNIK